MFALNTAYLDCAESVCDHQHGAPMHKVLYCLPHSRLALCIKVGGGLVQQDDGRILQRALVRRMSSGNSTPAQITSRVMIRGCISRLLTLARARASAMRCR